MLDEREKNKAPQESWWQPGLVLFARLSGWIAGPVIIAVFLGKWLDQKYHSKPWLFLLSVGLAFAISSIGIVKESVSTMKKIADDASENKNNKKNNSSSL